jgi:protein-L-isoaspartate(D-aspartate) O-methyltransferase
MTYEQQRTALVTRLTSEGYIHSDTVKHAFLTIHRETFLPPDQQPYAYDDTPLQIGHDQTISAPHMVAIMTEALDLHPGQHVLEIGAGSGYHAAIVATIIAPTGHLYTIERLAHLAQNATDNLAKAHITNATVITGDGSEGLPDHQPYDRIYVTAASPKIPPPLMDQLNENGKLLVPVGDVYCDLILAEKHEGKIHTKSLGGCVFVPLIGKYGF